MEETVDWGGMPGQAGEGPTAGTGNSVTGRAI